MHEHRPPLGMHQPHRLARLLYAEHGDEIVGMPFHKLQKVLATDLQHVVHEAVEPGLVLERKVALENHAVEALQCGGDRAPEFLDERIHGALLVVVRVKSNHHPVRSPFFNQPIVASGKYVTPQ